MSEQEPMSLRAYAARRKALQLPGGDPKAVRNAVKAKRLVKSLVWIGGIAQIADPQLADAEWVENTDATRRPAVVVTDAGAERVIGAAEAPAVELPKVPDGPRVALTPARVGGKPAMQVVYSDDSIGEARRKREVAVAALKTLEFQAKARQLCLLAEITAAMRDEYTICRTRLLAIPSKVKQIDPTITIAQVQLINEEIREALTGLADEAQQQMDIERAQDAAVDMFRG